MALQVIWTETAQKELKEILSYFAEDSVDVAQRVGQKILARAAHLVDFPRVGHFIPEIEGDRYRQLTVYRYRIIYRIEGDKVYIVGVIHSSRDFRKAWRGRANE